MADTNLLLGLTPFYPAIRVSNTSADIKELQEELKGNADLKQNAVEIQFGLKD